MLTGGGKLLKPTKTLEELLKCGIGLRAIRFAIEETVPCAFVRFEG
jgi:hypothetical protein